jgi:hypothetical protein
MSEPATPRAALRIGPADVAVLLAVLALGWLHLDFPFEWDQAMFTLGARVMDHGGFLYRDFWEQKQPAIYLFYWAAGRLFGFGEHGVHTLEVLWWTAFAVILLVSLRREFENAWVSRLAPLFVLGVYYASTTQWHLTQVEGLVALPLWLCLIAAARGAKDGAPSAARLFLSGLAGGVVLLFKLAFLPIVAAFWLVALARVTRARGPAGASASAGATILGAALPAAAVVAFFAAHGQLGPLWNATFVEPARLLGAIHGMRLGTLFEGLSWAGLRFGPLIALAALGLGPWRARAKDALVTDLVLWLALGAGVVLIQRFSWWQYHWLLLLCPLGVLAAAGVDAVWSGVVRGTRRGPAVALALGLLFCGHLFLIAGKGVMLARSRFATTPASRVAYQRAVSPLYDAFHRDLDAPFAAIRAARAAGDPRPMLFVVGNPLYYHVMDCMPPLTDAVGLLFETLPRGQWDALAERVGRTPPDAILVESFYDRLFTQPASNAAAFADLLRSEYQPGRPIQYGQLFVRRGLEAAVAGAEGSAP